MDLKTTPYQLVKGRSTWANIPAASGYLAGEMWFVTDLGATGCYMVSNGTRWCVINGSQILKTLGAPVSGIANSETIVLQTLIPAGAWQTNDVVRIFVSLNKSGTTDTLGLPVRVGTAGTTADTAIGDISTTAAMAAANQSGGLIYDIKLLSATTAAKMGNGSNATGSYSVSGTAVGPSATTITSAAGNPLYVSVGLVSSGASNTVGMSAGQIHLLTP